jgi:hypothetical protein
VPDADGVDLMTAPIKAPKTTWVCDWTHWQSKPLPAAGVANEGFGMVKIKAGGAQREGRFFEDPMFYTNAVALVRESRLIPAAYWFLMPGRASAQAGLFYDMLNAFGVETWAAFLDVEQAGLSWTDVHRFALAWDRLTGGQQLNLYTSARFWGSLIGAPPDAASALFPFLEEAHWVSEDIRTDPARPYASQHAKGINPAWWNVNYGGWETADMLQFTDTALVQGMRTVASMYRGTQSELREALR